MLDNQMSAPNTLQIVDLRYPKGAKMLVDPNTVISVYYDPLTKLVEYELVGILDGKKFVRRSKGFHERSEIHKAALKPQREPVTEERLGQLTQTQKKEAYIIPEQPPLRCLISDYVAGEITQQQRRELQEEIAREQAPTAPGGPK